MKTTLISLLLAASASAFAANHEVKMFNTGTDGGMVFEPGFLQAEPGDTITFKPAHKGHWVESKAVPEGAKPFASKADETLTVTLDREGLYVYTCPPHRMMNMNAVIRVGKALPNQTQAQAAADELEKRAMQNKGRLKKYMQQVK